MEMLVVYIYVHILLEMYIISIFMLFNFALLNFRALLAATGGAMMGTAMVNILVISQNSKDWCIVMLYASKHENIISIRLFSS